MFGRGEHARTAERLRQTHEWLEGPTDPRPVKQHEAELTRWQRRDHAQGDRTEQRPAGSARWFAGDDDVVVPDQRHKGRGPPWGARVQRVGRFNPPIRTTLAALAEPTAASACDQRSLSQPVAARMWEGSPVVVRLGCERCSAVCSGSRDACQRASSVLTRSSRRSTSAASIQAVTRSAADVAHARSPRS